MNKPAFVISLDFELYWGIGDHITYQDYLEYFDSTLEVIPQMLALFQSYGIHATWASVGMLCHKNWQEWNTYSQGKLPEYQNLSLSNYVLAYGVQKENHQLRHFFVHDLILQIQHQGHQELATHTYSHFYAYDCKNAKEALNDDLQKAQQVNIDNGESLTSLVMPRNQLKEEHLVVMQENGIKTVRSNPSVWYWKERWMNSKLAKLARMVDAYTNFFSCKSYTWQTLKRVQGVLLQPASRFFRPITGKATFLNKWRLKRILREMKYAAQHGEIYHLWWHPHNFARFPKQSLKDLQTILEYFTELQAKYGMESMTMREINIAFDENK